MAKIYNTDCTKGLAQNAAIQQNVDRVPNELAEKIVPTFETNPALLRRSTVLGYNGSAVTGSVTVVASGSTPPTKKTFITGFVFSLSKNAACDIATGLVPITIQPKGLASSTRLASIPVITLTEERMTISHNLSMPIELEPNTGLGYTQTFAAGSMASSCAIYGYQIDNANA